MRPGLSQRRRRAEANPARPSGDERTPPVEAK
jgi:hypothetical protein